jgi:hypothetical protein
MAPNIRLTGTTTQSANPIVCMSSNPRNTPDRRFPVEFGESPELHAPAPAGWPERKGITRLITPANLLKCEGIASFLSPVKRLLSVSAIAWTSFFFAVLQSVCTFFVGLGPLRLLLGATALVALGQVGTFWDRFHRDSIRVPMIGLALIGVGISSAFVMRGRRLRKRPASQWRQRTRTAREVRLERVQIALQIVTVALLAIEECMHIRTFHHL